MIKEGVHILVATSERPNLGGPGITRQAVVPVIQEGSSACLGRDKK